MKGQSTIEFLGSVLLFLIVLVASLTVMSNQIPEFTDDVSESSQNMEMYRISNQMMTKPGRHFHDAGGTDWDKNSSTLSSVEEFGLAEDFKVMDKTKVDNLSTTGSESFNYSQFRDLTNLGNQYFFNFTWFPIVETSESFTRTMPPDNPPINEPESIGSSLNYSNAENRVHYGSFKLRGDNYNFLVTAYDGVYNTTYLAEDANTWNFTDSEPLSEEDSVTLDGREFDIIRLQNRDRTPGSAVYLRRAFKSFGPDPTGNDEVSKLNRYSVLKAPNTDEEVVRMEVFSW